MINKFAAEPDEWHFYSYDKKKQKEIYSYRLAFGLRLRLEDKF